MSTPKKILKYPYKKENVLPVIEDCFAFIESHCIINEISTPENTYYIQLSLSYLFANNPPSSWIDIISGFLEASLEDSLIRKWRPIYLKDTLLEIKKEALSNE